MPELTQTFKTQANNYIKKLNNCFNENILKDIEILSKEILSIWENEKNIFICGNGGSSANAQHIANDFLYGIGIKENIKAWSHALPIKQICLC